MRLFCDQCGTEFGEGTLRTDSKFCSLCGKALSDYIKDQCATLAGFARSAGRSDQRHRTTPPGAKCTPSSTPSKKRKPAYAGLSETRESDCEEPKMTRSNERNTKNSRETDTNDEDPDTSTTENPESTEGAEVGFLFRPRVYLLKGLGKGKRIRKSTRRYTDEAFTLARAKKAEESPHATRSKASNSTNTTPTHTVHNLLRVILNDRVIPV